MKNLKKIIQGLIFCIIAVCMLNSMSVQAASKVKLNKTKATVYVGKTCNLKVKGTKEKVKWSSSDKKIAIVTSKGKVTGKKEGKAKITAKVGKKKYTCTVTVKSLKNHTHKFKYKKYVSATCTKKGYSLYKCSCGATKKESYTKALGHSQRAYKGDTIKYFITKEPTEKSKGTAKAVCYRCGKVLKKIKKIAFKDLYTYLYRDGGIVISDFADNYGGKIHIPDTIEGKKVIGIGEYAFSGCSSLTSITIPNSVTSIEYDAFYGCSSLTSITIPNSVTSIEYDAFYGCSSLTSITIPNSVTSIRSSAFSGCSSLTSVTIPNGVTEIGSWAFSGCSSLTSITIPNSVTSIGSSAFSGCSSLTSITIPFKTEVGEGAFDGCPKLTVYCFKGSSAEKRAIAENIKYDSSKIPTSADYLEYYVQDGNIVVTGYYGSLEKIDIPNILDGKAVTSIGDWAFSGCSSLTSVTIPNGVTEIGSWAFSGCSSLTSITIPNSVTSIRSSAFSGCSSLTSVTIPNGVTEIGSWAFDDCPDNLVIHGSAGSYAEEYANNYGITFQAM